MSNTIESKILPETSLHQLERTRPLRILDILILTGAIAFSIIVQQRLGIVVSLPAEYGKFVEMAAQILNCLGMGISIAAIYWLVDRKRRTGKFCQEPGHWILASSVLLPLVMTIVWLAFRGASADGFRIDEAKYLLDSARPTVFVLTASILAIGILKTPTSVWRIYLLFLTAMVLLISTAIVLLSSVRLESTGAWGQTSFTNYVGTTLATCYIASLITLIAAIVIDCKNRSFRDWLHWAGVLAVVCFFVFQPSLIQLVGFLLTKGGGGGGLGAAPGA